MLRIHVYGKYVEFEAPDYAITRENGHFKGGARWRFAAESVHRQHWDFEIPDSPDDPSNCQLAGGMLVEKVCGSDEFTRIQRETARIGRLVIQYVERQWLKQNAEALGEINREASETLIDRYFKLCQANAEIATDLVEALVKIKEQDEQIAKLKGDLEGFNSLRGMVDAYNDKFEAMVDERGVCFVGWEGCSERLLIIDDDLGADDSLSVAIAIADALKAAHKLGKPQA